MKYYVLVISIHLVKLFFITLKLGKELMLLVIQIIIFIVWILAMIQNIFKLIQVNIE